MSEEQIIEAIAVTHVELILIHPFREGNGRLSRLLADVMAVQGDTGRWIIKAGSKTKPNIFRLSTQVCQWTTARCVIGSVLR